MLLINKVAATVLTPEEFGIFGQFVAVSAIINMLSSAGLNNAIVRDVSAAEDSAKQATGQDYFWTMLLFSGVAAAVFLGLYPLFGGAWLGTERLTLPVILLALSIPGFSFYISALSYLSGSGQQRRSAALQAYGVLAGVAAFAVCVAFGRDLVGLSLGYLLFLLTPAAVMFVARPLPLAWPGLSWSSVRRKLGDSAAMFSAILFLPTALVLSRSQLAASAGWDTVAMWQVLTRLSDVYMQMFAIYFTHFFMQRLHTASDEWPLMRQAALLNLGAMAAVGALFYLFYDLAVRLLFTSEYLWGREFVLWQVGVDSLKVLTVVMMYTFIVQRRFKSYIAVELAQAALLLVLVTQTSLGASLQGLYWALLLSAALGLAVAAGLYFKGRTQ
ncbi:oligosaccharide flippase family protein [Deinococcus piscis]|uniref:oligosaccharide flippase family protein n=1 Tax=Deinococcus piscis TaxID=394230 RepID=UPI001E3F40DB|nr:oligosaccharide flippase family protein [Deinococcus piscis]